MIHGLGIRDEGLGSRVWGLGFRFEEVWLLVRARLVERSAFRD